jgi:alpha-glucosidase
MQPPAAWWRRATLYQVYVRSWKDSNGDGVGDLAGLRQGLDYLEWLGVDGLWLSPTMPSPNKDFGYDVSDYMGVDPSLGSMEDLEALVADARARGLKVLLDLVPNHTSNEHPWFVDARRGRDAEHRDWYVWADAKADGGPPNNWLDATGASAWEWDEASGQYYLHNFLVEQPDLNWWHPGVRDAFEHILRYWFDKGIAGFRIDVAHGLIKDRELRDNPPSTPEDHPAAARHGLRVVYSSRRPEVHEIYRGWRKITDSYDPERALLGETWEFDFERLAAFYGGEEGPELNLAFNFPFVFSELTTADLSAAVEGASAAFPPESTPVWTASNHDVGRFPTRWAHDDPAAGRAALVLLATLPGVLVLYYGDEIGMGDVMIPPELQVDTMSAGHGPEHSRDRGRTPMPWTAAPEAGFTEPGVRPWLPLGEHTTVNVESQRHDPGSTLNLTRTLLALRRAGHIGGLDRVERLYLDDQAWVFRVGSVVTAVNLSPHAVSVPVPEGDVVLSSDAGRDATPVGGKVELDAWEALILRVA